MNNKAVRYGGGGGGGVVVYLCVGVYVCMSVYMRFSVAKYILNTRCNGT